MVTMETRYHVVYRQLIIWNLKSKVAELLRRPRALIKKILYFTEDHQFFFMTGLEAFLILAGETCFGTGEIFSAKLLTGETTGALGQDLKKQQGKAYGFSVQSYNSQPDLHNFT